MNYYDIVLKNTNMIDEEGTISYGRNICILKGKIVKITENCQEDGQEVLDCSDHFITPGFVNLHTHVPMGILRGLAEDVYIEDWFNKEIFPYESQFTAQHVYYGALLGIHEMMDNGVTAFADHYFYAEAICDAVIESGIRGDIAPTLFGITDNFEESFESVTLLIEKRRNENNRLKLRMGPHSPYTCPLDTLKKIIKKAKELEVGIHIHLSETKEQVEESLKLYKKTPFEVLKEVGGFEIPVIIGHGLWITEEDRKYLNEKTYIAVSPKTYMKLGMGIGRIWEKSHELSLCIGTDGAASSNTLNPLEQVRLLALLGKLNDNARAFTLKEMWQILMKGHEALSFKSGILKEGYAADLLIWDLHKSNTYPVYNPLASILYSGESKNIVHSIIDGKFVKKNNEVLFMNNAIKEGLKQCCQDILSRGKGEKKVNY
ncbi:5-methylthioadenosine/S-adenosylhomocysteine deaminase [Anaerovirgula multivorans]|uniref:5-methylthioadenosine/S-adenosylhomocysteine deaminase n=1 Tax=Anaerovirgula multivorans TaxID=312168 RepID=A0A239FAN0_9FIRM|nr:amidohydrolase family protein [Anaerovirgula multivorans]SNS54090.1 5-methylthioadenosine/S-adenosylhomocysteine deaminase [Anaerovirgula multivorans]